MESGRDEMESGRDEMESGLDEMEGGRDEMESGRVEMDAVTGVLSAKVADCLHPYFLPYLPDL